MDFQKRLLALSEYGIRINTHEADLVITITYPSEDWTTIDSPDATIRIEKSQKSPATFHYLVPVTGDVESVFDLVEETVAYNRELEEKVVLFGEVSERLREIFAAEPIAKLRTLKFVFPEPVAKKTREKKAAADKKSGKKTPKKATKSVRKPKGGKLSDLGEKTQQKPQEDAVKATNGEMSDLDKRIMHGIMTGKND